MLQDSSTQREAKKRSRISPSENLHLEHELLFQYQCTLLMTIPTAALVPHSCLLYSALSWHGQPSVSDRVVVCY